MSFINNNWYIALAFCLFFFIGARQLGEIPGGKPRSRRAFGLLLFVFSLPAFLFPLGYLYAPAAAAPWYNTFRSVNRIELFSSLIAPAAGYATYMKPESPYHKFQSGASLSVLRAIKPLAFPFCILFISTIFIRPMIMPIDKSMSFDDNWSEGGVLTQPYAQTSGPVALINAMYLINKYVANEMEVVKGTYTDRAGTEFWYLARYAVNHGYMAKFIANANISEAPIPSVIPVVKRPQEQGAPEGGVTGQNEPTSQSSQNAQTGTRAYVALLGHSDGGALIVGDPLEGKLILSPDNFVSTYGNPGVILAISSSRAK